MSGLPSDPSHNLIVTKASKTKSVKKSKKNNASTSIISRGDIESPFDKKNLPQSSSSTTSLISRSHGRKISQVAQDNFAEPVWSVRFKDAGIKLSPDRLTATGSKGWSTVLLTRGAHFGCWYFEIILGEPLSKRLHQTDATESTLVQVSPLKSNVNIQFKGWPSNMLIPSPHIRIGWSCRYSRYDLPIGTDAFSVCLRDTDCSIVQQAKRIPYVPSLSPLGEGDVIGCGIVLGLSDVHLPDPTLRPELHPFLESGLLCNPAHPPPKIVNTGSCVEFTINGKSTGAASGLPIYAGTYHPGVSLYMGAECRINLGPQFVFPPPPLNSIAQELTGFSMYHPACRLSKPQFQ